MLFKLPKMDASRKICNNTRMNKMKLIILDRDGVINFDSDDYIKSPEEWHIIPGSLEAIKKLNDAGFVVAVATNQSGVGRGYYTEAVLDEIHNKMYGALKATGGHLDALVFCPHTPDAACECRKPKPGMLTLLLQKFNVQADEACMVGDALRDLEAAWALGCNAVLLKTGKGEKTLAEHQDKLEQTLVFDDLASFAASLIP